MLYCWGTHAEIGERDGMQAARRAAITAYRADRHGIDGRAWATHANIRGARILRC